MIEPIEGMPEGTLGFSAKGELTREEYKQVLLPAMRGAVESGEVRLLFELGPEFERMAGGAMAEDAKAGVELGVGHHAAWKRFAVVTDIDWVHHAISLFGWIAPGEVKLFEHAQLDDAKAWVAG